MIQETKFFNEHEMNSSKSIIQKSGISFGTSGARGLVSDFTPEVCAAFALSFTRVMQRFYKFNRVAIAIDNRPSSYQMAQAISGGLEQINVESEFYGVIPTPALAYFAMQENIPCIMVTGSHIPFDRNGLKFYRPEGEITKADESLILCEDVPMKALNSLPKLNVLPEAKYAYIMRNVTPFSKNTLTGKRIGIYEHSSAGRDIYREIFEQLGAEVISLGRSDMFIPIDTEAVSELDKEKALDWVREYNLDALFSTDGDGDRPLLSDEKGEWLKGDTLGILCSKLLKIKAISTPISCNTAIERSGVFEIVIRTKIGSPYVIAEFDKLTRDYCSVAGFEANGGYLLASEVEFNQTKIKPLPTRDAVLPAIIVLSQLFDESLSSLVSKLPHRFTSSDRIKNFSRERSSKLIENIKQSSSWLEKLGLNETLLSLEHTDGIRMTFENDLIVHLRPSGNAPELRCYVESDNQNEANFYVQKVLNNATRFCV
ncbi:Phosphoglucosamine mutase [Pseudoalteromonas sp. P1-9]|uniref:phosphomannomutase n=1 Tax=Pseudoalteromonas sp. P1-9 TaxID=1710354 RepID=UPI0007083C7E|nr:phosphomannomutase [Pseudoalteromonas sp. P1-9]KPV95294.1 Phosphoglucosamine mutase [Pseudoalteromonas sp. P1-9]